MSPLGRASIFVKLAVGFGIMLVLMAGVGGFSLHGMARLWQATTDLYAHPFTVSTEVLLANRQFSAINRALLRDVVGAADRAEAEAAIDRIGAVDSELAGHLALARQRYLGDSRDFDALDSSLANWRSLRQEIVTLVRRDQAIGAEAVLVHRGKAVDEQVAADFGHIVDFATARAAAFEQQASRDQDTARAGLLLAIVTLTLIGFAIAAVITRAIVAPLDSLRHRMIELAGGNLAVTIPDRPAGRELDAMTDAVRVFKQAAIELNDRSWVKSRVTELSALMQSAETPREFAVKLAGALTPLVGGACAAIHLWDAGKQGFELAGGYGLAPGEGGLGHLTRIGEGLVGQCAQGKTAIVVGDLPAGYLRIGSGLGEAPPRLILLEPVIGKDAVLAVIEIAALRPFSATQRALIDELAPVMALNLDILARNLQTLDLLRDSQRQTEELQASEEELRTQAEELRASEEELRASEEELRAQREELQATNEELTEKGAALDAARLKAESQVLELGIANRYKSEFLANMSHELRTPLNSVLILAKNLADNETGTLDADQIDSARIIHESGTHLLNLINDVLDLSKVEAGKMRLVEDRLGLDEFAASIRRRFLRLAEAKGLTLSVETDANLPPSILGDRAKLDQILNNLVGNAIKFTQHGRIDVRLGRIAGGEQDLLEIAVVDTGIGVPADKIDHIFTAFEQADGTTSRQFGGTGLGLTISRRLAQLMGGDIGVRSIAGGGSTFTLRLPLHLPAPDAIQPPPAAAEPAFEDDRQQLAAGSDVILVIEDDDTFAQVLCDMARRRGFKCLRAADGEAGLDLAVRYRPTGILLDVGLPGKDGWTVMAELKRDPATRAIPVHFITGIGDAIQGMRMGAAGFLTKPVEREQIDQVFDRLRHFSPTELRRVLIVDDDAAARKATSLLIHGDRVEIVEAQSGEQALARLGEGHFDCVVLDLMLPDISGFDLLDRAAARGIALPPVVVYSGKDLSDEENLRLRQYTDSIVIKGVRSPERLVDEVGLFLHSVQTARPAEPPPAVSAGGRLAGHTVLVVDDDMRNAFALSKVLRGQRLTVLLAQDGHKALAQLAENPAIDLVLMDVMMPGMDGIATTREIRKTPALRDLPIIALTAKAMAGDREHCLEAGANAHLSKPVDTDRLLEMIAELLPTGGGSA